ncbi:hypothetical protein MVLG_07205 [Microbotryum lychnidis-dioicae p1A1 Lamole]|uniref:LIM zinc-binding domain-containing protein n=1 Tax=Microbotryum lychnidis-dioicae (strain p1A1 Lamole / MvSl-1064) TaxID=683840 RepID=U5HJM5_USTV1|nr:hypothetical protein MVLG_07205 [Microbotryum lychnidis-dioicae p1A1 Lamole]|eukprot:KDE02225.1 hypothetical protein MVLG_07205 [Microbotryum lychnidis-dioicae p1A1 Lamole]
MPPTFAAAPKCTYCGKSVYFAEQTIGPAGKIYHKPCLKCSSCGKTLEPGALLDHAGDPYCKACYGKAFGTRGYGVGGALVADYHDPRAVSKNPSGHSQDVAAASLSASTPNSPFSASQAAPAPDMPCTGPSRMAETDSYRPRASLPNMPRPTVPPKPFLAGRASVSTPPGRISSDLCPRCQTTVYAAEHVLAAGSKWHKRCLRCAGCSTALASGQLNEKDGEPWCRHCYANKFGHLAHGLMSRPGLF